MRLDDRVTVQEPTESTDQYGETTITYTDGDSFWADAQPSIGRETREGSAPEESASVTLLVRTEDTTRLGLGRDSHLKWDGDVLRVNGVRSAERNGFDELSTTRVR